MSAAATFTVTVNRLPNHAPAAVRMRPRRSKARRSRSRCSPTTPIATATRSTIASVGTPAHGAGRDRRRRHRLHAGDGFLTAPTRSPTSSPTAVAESAIGLVTVNVSRLGRFVALSRDLTWMRAGSTAVTGDVGAIERRPGRPSPRRRPDDGGRDDVTVRIGVGRDPAAAVVSRRRRHGAAAEPVVDLQPDRQRPAGAREQHDSGNDDQSDDGAVRGAAGVSGRAGRHAEDQRREEQDGDARARRVWRGSQVGAGGTLVLTGGLYQVASIDLDASATIWSSARRPRSASRRARHSKAKAKLILDPSVPGLTASQVVIYVAGRDEDCRRIGADDDGDDAGPVAVHIGAQNVVQANIFATRGTDLAEVEDPGDRGIHRPARAHRRERRADARQRVQVSVTHGVIVRHAPSAAAALARVGIPATGASSARGGVAHGSALVMKRPRGERTFNQCFPEK